MSDNTKPQAISYRAYLASRNRTYLNLYLPLDLVRAVKKAAEKQGTSASQLVAQALAEAGLTVGEEATPETA